MNYLEIFYRIWEIINQNFISTLLGTFIGLTCAFYIDRYKRKKEREHIYGVTAVQVTSEWAANSFYAETLLETVESGRKSILRFNHNLIDLILSQSYIYEFAPRELIQKLGVYRENLMIANRVADDFFNQKSVTQEQLDGFKKTIAKIIKLGKELGNMSIR